MRFIGAGTGAISDNWDAAPPSPASTAFSFLFLIITLIQLYMIFKRLKEMRVSFLKGPYVLLGFVTSVLAAAYALWTIYNIVFGSTSRSTLHALSGSFHLLLHVDLALRPGIVLHLMHTWGYVLSIPQDHFLNSVMLRAKKRVIDLALVAFSLSFLFAVVILTIYDNLAMDLRWITFQTYQRDYTIRLDISHIAVVFLFLTYVDVIVSSVLISTELRKRDTIDPVLNYILVGICPFFFILAIKAVIMDLQPPFRVWTLLAELHPTADFENDPFASSRQTLSTISTIISGVCRVVTTAVLIRTITFVNGETTKVSDSATHGSSEHELSTYLLKFFKDEENHRPDALQE
ncbi:hypothetical protein CPB86DRAFT_812820 [Serendipita vermifera]|nr:hypothetical protein CPB86DRAFT_812820 [Serendipita vermifera]